MKRAEAAKGIPIPKEHVPDLRSCEDKPWAPDRLNQIKEGNSRGRSY